jgi:AraC-like DNA-binding protein
MISTPTPPADLIEYDALQGLWNAREFIDRLYAEPLALRDAAREAGLSPFYFHRLFRRAFGETPHRYLTRRRMAAAQRLLLEGRLTVTEVCLAVGFQSLGSFSALFTRETGRPPSALLRRLVAPPPSPDDVPKRPFVPACFRIPHRVHKIRVDNAWQASRSARPSSAKTFVVQNRSGVVR